MYGNPEMAQQKIQQYIKETAIPTLTSSESSQLECDFSMEEIQRVIDSLVPGKSPGPDGFTPRFYKTFKTELMPIMKQTFNAVSTTVPFGSQSMQAYITLVPKIDKDHTLCGNYRPISLTNLDLRIYSKIIANRLTPIIPRYIHLDQVGFVKGREARDNTLKTLTLLEYVQRGSIPSCLLAIDAEKAFERVGWSFLKETLIQWGLGAVMIDKIMTLYQHPTAKIRANSNLSGEIMIANGTRQGCPLSPILYILIMEHLLNAIRANKDIQGIRVGDTEYKLSVYADDILMYVTNPLITLPNLIREFNRFGILSNFKVNYNKSEAMNINMSRNMVELLKKDFPFRWQENAIKYLGTYIPTDLKKLEEYNYVPMVQKITKTLQQYNRGTFSWLGRVNVIKMDILPKILYILQAIPVFPALGFLKKVSRIIGQFVWAGKTPRISRKVLNKTKANGGLSLPDIAIYLKAVMVTRLVDWFHNRNKKLWVGLEEEITGLKLKSLPWIKRTYSSPYGYTPFLVTSTMKAWDILIKTGRVSTFRGPMTPLFDNPEFPLSLGVKSFLKWYSHEDTRVIETLVGNKVLPLESMGEEHRKEWLQYGSFQKYVLSLLKEAEITRPLTALEEIFIQAERPSHVLSKVYKILIEDGQKLELPYIKKWEEELGMEIPRKEWEKALAVTHKLSVSTKHQERNYKILARWYKCPVDLYRISPTNKEVCWRCQERRGTMSHIWYYCSKILPFWQKIFEIFRAMTAREVYPDIQMAVLSMIPGSMKSIKKGPLKYFLTAARTCIARKWKCIDAPSMVEWECEMTEMRTLQERKVREEGSNKQIKRTTDIWKGWVTYSASSELLCDPQEARYP